MASHVQAPLSSPRTADRPSPARTRVELGCEELRFGGLRRRFTAILRQVYTCSEVGSGDGMGLIQRDTALDKGNSRGFTCGIAA